MDFDPDGSAVLGDNFQQNVQNELDEGRRSLKEVNLMLEQSQGELTKLTQRNAAITGHLQQLQGQFESTPREEIKMAYASAMEAQQRLLVMRGQIEKLHSDQTNLQKLVEYLEAFQEYCLDGGKSMSGSEGGNGSKISMLEMLIRTQESERQRLSRQMHDGPAQALSNFIVQVEIAARLFDLDPNRAKEEMANLKSAAMTTFQKVRTFIFELRPMMLDDLGLLPTIRRYVDSFKEQTGADVSVDIKGQERRLDEYQEVVVFRSLQEFMGNAVRHNEDHPGKLQITVQVVLESNLIRAVVSDNGKGFDPDDVEHGDGIGLKLIRERVEMLGGTLEIDTSIGNGCKVMLNIPLEEE